MISTELLEWAGAAFGLAGATLLALNALGALALVVIGLDLLLGLGLRG